MKEKKRQIESALSPAEQPGLSLFLAYYFAMSPHHGLQNHRSSLAFATLIDHVSAPDE